MGGNPRYLQDTISVAADLSRRGLEAPLAEIRERAKSDEKTKELLERMNLVGETTGIKAKLGIKKNRRRIIKGQIYGG